MNPKSMNCRFSTWLASSHLLMISGGKSGGHWFSMRAALLLSLVVCSSSEAATYVNRDGQGNIRDVTLGATSWNAAGSPYIIEGNVTIAEGATLSVGAGTAVQVTAQKGIYISGNLQANSANFTINGEGHWLGIYLSGNATGSVISGCTVNGAGANNLGYFHSGYRQAAIYVDQCAVTINNNTISDSAGCGIEVYPNGGTIQNNNFVNMAAGNYAMVYDGLDTFPTVSGNSASGNGIAGIWVPSGSIGGTKRLNYPGANFPYYLTGGGDYTIAENSQLTLDPGVAIRMGATRMVVNGTLSAPGTSTLPISITSAQATPAPGDWMGILFNSTAGASSLSYVTLSHAGRSSLVYAHAEYRYATVYLDTCNPAFDHCTISQSAVNGVEMYASTATFANGVIQNCGGNAFKAEAGSRPLISNASLTGNGTASSGYYTVLTDASSVPNPSQVTFANNRLQGVQIKGGTLGADATWENWAANAPYVVTADVNTGEGVKLTIEQGTVIKVSGALFRFFGPVVADGTPSAITFTSVNDDSISGDSNGDSGANLPAAGDWKGIYLGSTAAQTLFNHCNFRYAGANNLGYLHAEYVYSALYADSCPFTITNSVVANSAGNGVTLWSSPAVIRDNQFQDFEANSYAVRLVNVSEGVIPAMSGNTTAGTGILGVSIPGGTMSNTNTWNKPGANFPYFLNSELTLAESGQWNLDPGVTIKSANQRILLYGNLQALGTVAEPVVFTSRNAAPAPGDWRGIYFGETAGRSLLRQTKVSYAGQNNVGYIHAQYRYTSLYVDGCSPQFDHLTVSDSAANGVELWASQSSFTSPTFYHCGGHAFKAESQSRPTLTTPVFQGNGWADTGYYTVGIDASCVPVPSNATFTTNRMSGVQIWGGTLDASGTWNNWAANAPYVLTKDVSVADGATLTVAPSTVVKVQTSRLLVNGHIVADGTAGKINFTSYLDDALAGDSNGDFSTNAPAPADWMGIYLAPSAGSPLFKNCGFRYAGRNNLGYINSAYRYATVYVDGCTPTFENCVIADSGLHGLEFYRSTAIVKNCQFNNFGTDGYPIVQNTLDCHLTLSGNSNAGTGVAGIALPGGTMAGNVTFNNPGTGLAYMLNGNLTIAEGVTLQVDPGVTFKAGAIGLYVYGTLLANGSAAAPVKFTSNGATPAAGDWKGIYFSGTAGNSVFNYTEVSAAGRNNLDYIHSVYQKVSLYIDGCSPRFNHLTITDSEADGIACWASKAAFSSLTIRNCGRYAIRAESQSRPTISGVSFANNGFADVGYYTVGMDASCVPVPSGAAFSGNRKTGVQIWGGTLTGSGEWKNWASNAPYVLTADSSVASGVTLTIEAGTTVKAQSSRFLVYGTLLADGSSSPIGFTSYRDDTLGGDSDGDSSTPAAGDWHGIYLSPDSGQSVLANCAIRYAGANNLGYIHSAYRMTSLYVDTCSPVISNCAIAYSAGHGIELFSSSANLTGCSFMDAANGYYALVFNTLDCFPTMSGNSAAGQGYPGISIPGGGMGVSGTWMRPGTNFPYYLNGDVTVGDQTTLYIAPGVTLLTDNKGFYVNGTLSAVGSPALPIRFDSRKASPAPGDWKGIYLGGGAGASRLNFCIIANAGANNLGYFSSGYRQTAIYVDGSAPELASLEIRNSLVHGIMFAGSSGSLINSLVASNQGDGIVSFNGGTPQFINNTIVNSGGSGVHCYAGSPAIVNSVITFNQTGILNERDAGAASRYNCVSGNSSANYNGLSAGAGDISSSPNFAGAAAGNYRLISSSPAINAGNNGNCQPTWMDLDGNLRVSNGTVDMGAYEYNGIAAQHVIDAMIRNAGDSDYIGSGTTVLDNQTKTQTATLGSPVTFQFKVKYSGNISDRVRVSGPGTYLGWNVKYFSTLTGAVEITSEVTQPGGWLVSSLNPGDTFELRAEITPATTVASGTFRDFLVSATSAQDPSQGDTVRARVYTPVKTTPGTSVYQTTFVNPAGSEWSNGHIETTPNGARPFLGQFGNTNTVLTLTGLPAHSAITLEYDLYVIGPWDGNGTAGGTGIYAVEIVGTGALLNTTFNNAPETGAANGQSYPQPYFASNPARTGAAETNALGYTLDTVYHLSQPFYHMANSVSIQFSATGLGEGETWGLANLAVYITATDSAPATLKSLGMKSDGFHILISGNAQQTYQLQATADWVNWTDLGSVQLQSNSVETVDATTPRPAKRFYRALQIP